MHTPSEALQHIFGHAQFRPGQQEIVETVIAGRDTLAIMPTGGGKSLCYQLPALCRDGVTVVISPLIALMRDQVRALRALGVEAGALTSGNTEAETAQVRAALDAGRLKLLYMAPERLSALGTASMLRAANVRLIAVDEAHCVSQWGHDFRPDYLRIGDLRRALDVPLAAFTATADAETQTEIINRLFDGKTPVTFLRGFDRPNIHLAFAAKEKPRVQLMDFIAARRGQSGIIYCASRARTEVLAQALAQAGHSACAYHGGMDADARRTAELRFGQEEGLIVVATVAFGMGVDKPDIRWVAHADLPKSVEAYYQEIGRAGRDGAPAETLTLFGADDVKLRRTQIDEGAAPDARKAADHARLNALLGLAEAQICRRQILLRYFGEEAAPCGYCDICDNPPEVFDATEAVRMALSAALRTEERFGASYLTDILLGVSSEKIKQNGHDALPTYGVGRGYSRNQWGAVLRQMMGLDLLRPDPARFGGLYMTPAARPILTGAQSITLRKDSVTKAAGHSVVKALVSEDAAPLLSALKAKRNALAKEAGVPAYIIFPDRSLIEMAETRPTSLDAFARISGVGAKKLETFGAAFLEVITGAKNAVHPARRALAGRGAGDLYDQLTAVASALYRGENGTEKPLSLTPSELRRIAERRPANLDALERAARLGPAKLARFGDAFLAAVQDAS